MNFLAHAFLSVGDPELLVGNMIADAVKGKDADNYPKGIRRGILLHRAIDAYTDQHEMVKKTRKLFYPVIRHYSLVISDVIYDHYLGKDFNRYTSGTLKGFAKHSYKQLEERKEFFPPKFAIIFPYMKQHDWFVMYSTRNGMHQTIERLAHRSPAFIWPKETIQIFEDNYEEIWSHFYKFFPELWNHCQVAMRKIIEDEG